VAVKVQIASNPGNDKYEDHPEGGDFEVSDGALIVSASDGNRKIAVYAPSKWLRAEVTK
jgi:hypothetical protein